ARPGRGQGRDQGHQPAGRGGLLVPPLGHGVEEGRGAEAPAPLRRDRHLGGLEGIAEEAAVGFARGADDYVAARPGYPAAAVDVLGVGAGVDVLDLAAGTGKLTVDLVARGSAVVAVEPIPEMRAKLADVEGVD